MLHVRKPGFVEQEQIRVRNRVQNDDKRIQLAVKDRVMLSEDVTISRADRRAG